MRDYELVYIISPELDEEATAGVVERISQFVSNRGGEIVEVNQWGRRRLAYPIKHQVEGNYILAQLRMPPEVSRELESSFRVAEDILRHLLVRR